MNPISEEEEEPPPSCCSCLFGGSKPQSADSAALFAENDINSGTTAAKEANANNNSTLSPATTNENGITSARVTRPGMGGRHRSVYISARESLDAAELKALKEFEDALVFSIGGDESLYFDALDASEGVSQDDFLQYAPARTAQPRQNRESVLMDDPSSLLKVMEELKEPRVKVALSGYPGKLTESELAACQQLRAELQKRKKDVANDGKVYDEIVRVYNAVETEPYALCRFLRARQFDVDRVFEMIDECTDHWRKAREHEFYPDPSGAVSAPVNVFLTQFPIIDYGCAKTGAPVSYARAHGLSIEGMDCLSDLGNLANYAWYSSYHSFKNQVTKAQKKNPDLVRCEMLQVFDLKNLAASTLNARTLHTLQGLIAVNKCFPEVLNCMVILNVPRFFTFFWRVIKSMLDPRTASKITVFSNEQEGINWLLERVDKSELLSDYGGTGPSFGDVQNESAGGGAKRQIVKLFSISNRSFTKETFDFSLESDETVELKVYTRSEFGAGFELTKDGEAIGNADVNPPGANGTAGAYVVTIFQGEAKGPGDFRITSTARTGADHFVVAGEVN